MSKWKILGILRPKHQEVAVIEKIVCYSSQEEEACHRHPGKHWGPLEGGTVGKSLFKVSAGMNGRGREPGLRLARLNHFSGLWGTGPVPTWLQPGPAEVIRADG